MRSSGPYRTVNEMQPDTGAIRPTIAVVSQEIRLRDAYVTHLEPSSLRGPSVVTTMRAKPVTTSGSLTIGTNGDS